MENCNAFCKRNEQGGIAAVSETQESGFDEELAADNLELSAYLDSLGWVYFKLGRLNLAEESLKKAVERISDDPTIYDHLGDVYLALGKADLAIRSWEKALKWASEEDSKRIQKKLKERETGTLPTGAPQDPPAPLQDR